MCMPKLCDQWCASVSIQLSILWATYIQCMCHIHIMYVLHIPSVFVIPLYHIMPYHTVPYQLCLLIFVTVTMIYVKSEGCLSHIPWLMVSQNQPSWCTCHPPCHPLTHPNHHAHMSCICTPIYTCRAPSLLVTHPRGRKTRYYIVGRGKFIFFPLRVFIPPPHPHLYTSMLYHTVLLSLSLHLYSSISHEPPWLLFCSARGSCTLSY